MRFSPGARKCSPCATLSLWNRPFYTVAEAATYLRVGKDKTFYDLIKRGLLQCSLALREKRLLKGNVHTYHVGAPAP